MPLRRPATASLTLFALGIALLVSAVLLVITDSVAAQDDPPLPEPRGEAILDHILRVDPYVDWGSWATDAVNMDDFSGYLPSAAPHGTAVRIFVNDIALYAVADPAFEGELPPGSIIVKENYAPTRTSPAELVALTVMVKAEDFYPRGGDWFWLKTAPDGSAIDAEGAVRGCVNCHQESASDYLLRYLFPGMASTGADGALDDNALVESRCTVCHTRERIDAASKDAAEWAATVDRMVSYGAQLGGAERDQLIAYLAQRGATIIVDPNNPEQIINVRCTVCHSRARIDDEDGDYEDWNETISDMQSYGAQLTPQERTTLLNYLVATHGKDSGGSGHGGGGDDHDDDDD